jgi:hypothetical protein
MGEYKTLAAAVCSRYGRPESRLGGDFGRRRRRHRRRDGGFWTMNAPNSSLAKFRLSHIVATPNALTRLAQDDILAGIKRHQAGDWGDVPEEDRQENELSLQQGFRLLSAYDDHARIFKTWLGVFI